MKKSKIILTIATTILFSCGRNSKSTPDTKDIESTKTMESIQIPNHVTVSNDKYIDTRYEYADSKGKKLIIENSLPKGGQKYTDPNGKEYVYAIFWTRITNETDNPYEVTIEFPAGSFDLPSSSGNYFYTFLPPDSMTIDKESLFDYGLTGLETFLDNGLHKSSSLQRTIDPKGTSTFYVVTLFNRWVEGVVRAGFKLKEQNLIYSVNDKQIHCGQINFKY